MKLSIVGIVVLRLFAIGWAVRCVVGVLGAAGVLGVMPSGDLMLDVMQVVVRFAVPTAYGIFAVVAWLFAAGISRRVVGATDPEMGFGELRAEDLYGVGILVIGLYFALGHLAESINWLHYLVANEAGQALLDGRDDLSLYELTTVVIPCAVGAALACLAPKLGRKLARSIAPAARVSGDEDGATAADELESSGGREDGA